MKAEKKYPTQQMECVIALELLKSQKIDIIEDLQKLLIWTVKRTEIDTAQSLINIIEKYK